jgi:hypothetical protein
MMKVQQAITWPTADNANANSKHYFLATDKIH